MTLRNPLRLSHFLLQFLLAATTSTAQILTTGNTQFPACAQNCGTLGQAVDACSGRASSNQGTWSCFCQSGYLTALYQSPANICADVCTNPSDQQQLMTWYRTNCGTDNGASEHSGNGGGTQTTAGQQSSSTAASRSSSTAAGSKSTSTSSSGSESSTNRSSGDGSWWSTHYRWIIMLIVIFVGLILLAILAVWFKRRHDRKADQINGSFNEGITTRSAPNMASVPNPTNSPYPSGSRGPAAAASASGVLEPVGSGRASPARTRDAFMPYGYGYSRSESRLERSGVADDTIESVSRGSPLARGGTPVDELEKAEGKMAEGEGKKGQKRRVLVRERDIGKDGDR